LKKKYIIRYIKKIVGMATGCTTVNNTLSVEELSIKELMRELPSYYDEEPDEIIKFKCGHWLKHFDGSGRDQKESGIEVVTIDTIDHSTPLIFTKLIFYDKHTHITLGEKEIRVFHKKYRDPVSGKTYRSDTMIPLKHAEIVNEYIFNTPVNTGQNTTACMYQCLGVMFVLNIEDMQKKHALALRMIEKHLEQDSNRPVLPSELVGLISKEYFSESEMSSPNFKLEYKDEIPQVVSKDQLKQLYKAGLVKVAVKFGGPNPDYYGILSDEAFNAFPIIRAMCEESKWRMNQRKSDILNRFFSHSL
jgi:hypothetical protein